MRCYVAPQEKERGISFRAACLINLRGVFLMVLINEDLTMGPGVVGGFATALEGFLVRRRAYLAYSRKDNEFRELLS